jgi:3-mercaptopyruvate sulfurtransferase SseA
METQHKVPFTLDRRRTISPIVSTDWLEQNLESPNLVIVDIRNLAAWIWDCHADEDGTCAYYTYKDTAILGEMAFGAIRGPRDNQDQEIIVYCGLGGYGSAWWFVPTQVLGYKDVKLYDGAIQEWGPGYLDNPMVAYRWE